MSISELETKAKELLEMKRMREEPDGEIAMLEDGIKAHMTAQGIILLFRCMDHRRHMA